MTPRLDDIRRDDDWLDALGARAARGQEMDGDDAIALLAQWVEAIDHVPTVAETTEAAGHDHEAGRYARRGLSLTGVRRVASVSGIALAAISVSSVAAAVSGTSVPVFRELGTVTRGLVGTHELPRSTRAIAAGPQSPTGVSPHSNGIRLQTDTDTSTGDVFRPNGDGVSAGESDASVHGSATDPTSVRSPRTTSQWVWTGTRWVPSTSSTTRSVTSKSPTSTSTPTSTRTSTQTRTKTPTTTGSTSDTATTSSTTSTRTRPSHTRTNTSDPSSTASGTVTQPSSTAEVTSTERGRPSTTDRTRRSAGQPSTSAIFGVPTTSTPVAPTLPMPPQAVSSSESAASTDPGTVTP